MQVFTNFDQARGQLFKFRKVSWFLPVVGSHPSKLRFFGGARDCRGDHDVDVTEDRFFPEGTKHFQSVMSGKVQVQHDDARVFFPLPLILNELKSPFSVGQDFENEILFQVFERPA
ncbi:MAG TPA: hypothetical protein VGN17_10415 [Bryobacteraceae bacterium]